MSALQGPYAVVNVSELPASSGNVRRSINNPRHYPDATLLAEQKQAMAAHKQGNGKGGGGGKGGGHGKHTPTPTPTATPSPSPTATPTPTPTATPSPTPTASPTPSSTPTPTSTPSQTPTPSPTATPVSPPANASFNGTGFGSSGGYVPPDTAVAAGPVYVFQAVNLEGQIFTKDGQSVKKFSLYSFFKASTSVNLTDPRVLYDASSGHWFVITSTFGPSTAYGWNLAVSATSDPTGTWYLYNYPTSGSFPDFPKMGVNQNKLVITGDAFSGNNYIGTEFVVFNKSKIIAGAATTPAYFAPSQGDFAIEPAQHLAPTSTTTTSNSDALYMAAVNYGTDTRIDVWTVTGVPDTSQAVKVAINSLPINTLQIPPNASQPGRNSTVDTNDDALLDAVFRDGSPGQLWVSGTDACTPKGDNTVRSCLRLIEISIDQSASPTMQVAQDFDYSQSGYYLFFPALRTDNQGNLVVVFNGSSSSQYVSVYSAIQHTTDAPDTLGNPTLLHAGNASYTQSARWGDYSGAGVDPYDDATVWLGGEYAATCGSSSSCWGTWIAGVHP